MKQLTHCVDIKRARLESIENYGVLVVHLIAVCVLQLLHTTTTVNSQAEENRFGNRHRYLVRYERITFNWDTVVGRRCFGSW